MKRHTALIKRMRQSLGTDNHEQILKDINSLSLEKYVDELAGAVLEGIARCKTEKDVWSAVEVRCESIASLIWWPDQKIHRLSLLSTADSPRHSHRLS